MPRNWIQVKFGLHRFIAIWPWTWCLTPRGSDAFPVTCGCGQPPSPQIIVRNKCLSYKELKPVPTAVNVFPKCCRFSGYLAIPWEWKSKEGMRVFFSPFRERWCIRRFFFEVDPRFTRNVSVKSSYLTHIEITWLKNQNKTTALKTFPDFPRRWLYTTVQLFKNQMSNFSLMLGKTQPCRSLTISLPSCCSDHFSLGGKTIKGDSDRICFLLKSYVKK